MTSGNAIVDCMLIRKVIDPLSTVDMFRLLRSNLLS